MDEKQKSGFSHRAEWEKPNTRKKRNYKGIGSKKEVVKNTINKIGERDPKLDNMYNFEVHMILNDT